MLEGLAAWALLIYLLRLVGMPWNKGTKIFAYFGGTTWLLFVWVALINFAPMDLSGGSVVQAPHIQLRSDALNVKGKVTRIHISPNQKISKGQAIYDIDNTQYVIAKKKAKVRLAAAKVSLTSATQEVLIVKAAYLSSVQEVSATKSQLNVAKTDLILQKRTRNRFLKQNRVAPNTVTEINIDQQETAVEVAKHNVVLLNSQVAQKKADSSKAQLNIKTSMFKVESRKTDVLLAQEALLQADWELRSTKVFAPSDGFVTNFILREGQRVSVMPRIQMYTNEKYVLMRVNHQAIRNVKAGLPAEFTTAVYPGHIFAATVEGIIEATGEAQATLLGNDDVVSTTTKKNLMNKYHFVRLKVEETEGFDIPIGSVGLAWISAEKPSSLLGFLDVIRAIIIRMKSQIYYFYSL